MQFIPEVRGHVLALLGHDPTILSRAPAMQMKALIVDPLNMIPNEALGQCPRVIIINGLDECINCRSQDTILKFLAQFTQQLTSFHFLISSRPQLEIRDTSSSDILRPITHTLPLEHDHQSNEDVYHFFTSKFQKLLVRRPHLPEPKADVDTLAKKSSGHFIYAATVIRYIESRRHQPKDRLKMVLDSKSSEGHPICNPRCSISPDLLFRRERSAQECLGCSQCTHTGKDMQNRATGRAFELPIRTVRGYD